MEGVLPIRMKTIMSSKEKNIIRFYKACIGWIRYKPLLLYITDREHYEQRIAEMREQLRIAIPKICTFFDKPEFSEILPELDKYDKNVRKHFAHFEKAQADWARISGNLKEHALQSKEDFLEDASIQKSCAYE
jgi:hypothetical protein